MGIELDNEDIEVCGQLLFQNETYFIDRHRTRDQRPGCRVRQGRGRARQQPLRPPLRMHESRRLQGVLPAQEHAVQVLPPVQLALPRVRGAEVRQAAPEHHGQGAGHTRGKGQAQGRQGRLLPLPGDFFATPRPFGRDGRRPVLLLRQLNIVGHKGHKVHKAYVFFAVFMANNLHIPLPHI